MWGAAEMGVGGRGGVESRCERRGAGDRGGRER